MISPNIIKLCNNFYSIATRPADLPENLLEDLTNLIIKKIIESIRNNNFRPGSEICAINFSTPNVKKDLQEIYVIVLGVSGDDPERIIYGGGKGKAKEKNVVIIKVNTNVSSRMIHQSIVDGVLKLDIYEILVHELTHAIDIINDGIDSFDPYSMREDVDPKKYYNKNSCGLHPLSNNFKLLLLVYFNIVLSS